MDRMIGYELIDPGSNPHIPDYPEALMPFLGRKIWKDTINSISGNEEKWSAGYFVC